MRLFRGLCTPAFYPRQSSTSHAYRGPAAKKRKQNNSNRGNHEEDDDPQEDQENDICHVAERPAQPRRAIDIQMQPRRAPSVGWRGLLALIQSRILQTNCLCPTHTRPG